MEIKLLNLSLVNFKGIKKFTTDFADETLICGENATGKTTLFDAFTWLLFGKDSKDKKDFSIKTLDKSGKPIHKLEHEVTGVLDIDGSHMIFKRVLKEKWVKKRGSEESEFTGHVTDFFIDEVPLSQNEYRDKVSGIIDEDVFKMITSTSYFNSLDKKAMRETLFTIAGKVSIDDIVSSNEEFKKLMDKLGSKSLDDYKKQLASQRKRLRESIEGIPTRVDEINRNMPEMKDPEETRLQIIAINSEIEKIDAMLNDSAKKHEQANQKNQEKQNKIYQLKRDLLKMENDEKDKIDILSRDKSKVIEEKLQEVLRLEKRLQFEDNSMVQALEKVKSLTKETEDKRAEWYKENEKTLSFDENEFSCPACKRPFEADDIESKKAELTANFNKSKLQKLETIQSEGAELNHLKELKEGFYEQTKNDLAEIEKDLKKVKADLKNVQETSGEVRTANFSEIPGYNSLKEEIQNLEAETAQVEMADNSDLITEKQQKNLVLDSLKRELAVKEVIEQNKGRIQELLSEEKSLAQQIADLEKDLFAMENMERVRVGMIEEKVNGMFSYVRFKMFRELINGGYEPHCETIVGGVPFPDVNNASKINAGIDIINTLSKHYKVSAPIWIDNRESVNTLIDTDSQIINLVVTQDEALTLYNYRDVMLAIESIKGKIFKSEDVASVASLTEELNRLKMISKYFKESKINKELIKQ